MTFRTYLPIATSFVVAAVFSVVDGAVGQSTEPPSASKAAVHHVGAPAR